MDKLFSLALGAFHTVVETGSFSNDGGDGNENLLLK